MRGSKSVTRLLSIKIAEKAAHFCAVLRKGNTMNDQTEAPVSVAIGTWIGREQAFNALAQQCSSARVACLKQVRDTEAYKSLTLTCEEFCPQQAGISSSQAAHLIGPLAEFSVHY